MQQPENDVIEKPHSVRDAAGRFVPGLSGNPKGRPKGLRNYKKQLQLGLETAVREHLASGDNADKIELAIDNLLEIATGNNDQQALTAIKILMDNLVTKPKDTEDAGTGNAKIQIVIENNTDMTAQDNGSPVRVIDADFEEIKDGP